MMWKSSSAWCWSSKTKLVAHAIEIEQLKLLIAKLRRLQFGRSSEKLSRQIEQLELRLEELQTVQAQALPFAPAPEASAGETGT